MATKPISLTLQSHVVERIKQLSEEESRSLSQVTSKILEKALGLPPAGPTVRTGGKKKSRLVT